MICPEDLRRRHGASLAASGATSDNRSTAGADGLPYCRIEVTIG
jgi:hypothetical protein